MITMDPVVLAGVLGATGPVTVEGQLPQASNAVDTLLATPTSNIATNEQQNALFTGTMRAMLDKILNGQFDPAALVRALDTGVASAACSCGQRTLTSRRRSGRCASAAGCPTERHAPEVGVYLNDSASDKLTYYLDHEVDVRPRRAEAREPRCSMFGYP